jgi:hypothetical protein
MRVTLTFGIWKQPNIPRALAICRKQGWKFDIMTTSFFLSRRSLKAPPFRHAGVARKAFHRAWRARQRMQRSISRSGPDAGGDRNVGGNLALAQCGVAARPYHRRISFLRA